MPWFYALIRCECIGKTGIGKVRCSYEEESKTQDRFTEKKEY